MGIKLGKFIPFNTDFIDVEIRSKFKLSDTKGLGSGHTKTTTMKAHQPITTTTATTILKIEEKE